MNDLEKVQFVVFAGARIYVNLLVCIQPQFCHLRGPKESNVHNKIIDSLTFKLANTSSHIGREIINFPPCVFP